MDIQPKTGGNGLRDEKMKGYHQKIGPRQKHKFRNTLEQWLVKPSKKQRTAEVCQTHKDVEMTDDCQSSSAQCLDSQNPSLSTSDEETQPLTPQDLDENSYVSLAPNEEQAMEVNPVSSDGSVKHNTKITDFFLRPSSAGLPVRQGRPDKYPAKGDTGKETTSACAKWLGTPISELKRMPGCFQLPALKDVPGLHTVMIRV